MYNFDYFYNNQDEQYQVYLLPKFLFKDDMFRTLSSDAKILYSLLIAYAGQDEFQFQDEHGRLFIYFPYENAMYMLNCAKEKMTKTFKELDEVGLIERKIQGLGKPCKIYVKHIKHVINEENIDS